MTKRNTIIITLKKIQGLITKMVSEVCQKFCQNKISVKKFVSIISN